MARAKRELPTLPRYEADFYSWALEQALLLRERRLAELDLDNLADEVEDLARREAKELRSRYETLLRHLLKWEFQPDKRSSGWQITIGRERREIPEHLAENPGLQPRRAELFVKAYPTARDNAAIETKLPLQRFPVQNPYTLDMTLDPEFWPGGQNIPLRGGKRRRGSA
jgi:hypothetical protein